MPRLKFSSAKRRGFNDFYRGITTCPFQDELLVSFWAKGVRIAEYLDQRAKRKAPVKKGTLVRVLAQYEENYGFYEGKQAWKPKGGLEFEVRVETFLLMYCKEEVTEVINEFLQEESNEASRVSLIEWEPIFHEPVSFDQVRFDSRLQAKLATKEAAQIASH